jgi:hypothetical protein
MFNNAPSFNRTPPSVFGNSGRPVSGMPGMGLGQNLSAAATAGKQNPNLAAKVAPPKAVPATATGVQTMTQPTKTAALLFMLKSAQGGAPVPGPAGMPPTPGTATVVPPAPPGPTPPPPPGPTPIPMHPRQQPLRARTQSDDRQQSVLAGLVSDGERARAMPDRAPIAELESDLMTRGKIGSDSISAFSKFAGLYKKSRQDNSKPSRSGMGDQNGLTYEQRKEDHATGADAWASLDRFKHKKANDVLFADAFVDTCIGNGMNLDQIANAVIKVGSDFDKSVQTELIAGLEKIADYATAIQALPGKLIQGISDMTGAAKTGIKNWGSGVAEGASNVVSHLKPNVSNTIGATAGGATGAVSGYNAHDKDADPSTFGRLKSTLMGGLMGAVAGGVNSNSRESAKSLKARDLPLPAGATRPNHIEMTHNDNLMFPGKTTGKAFAGSIADTGVMGTRGYLAGNSLDAMANNQLLGQLYDEDGKPLPNKSNFTTLLATMGGFGGLFSGVSKKRHYDADGPELKSPAMWPLSGAGVGAAVAMDDYPRLGYGFLTGAPDNTLRASDTGTYTKHFLENWLDKIFNKQVWKQQQKVDPLTNASIPLIGDFSAYDAKDIDPVTKKPFPDAKRKWVTREEFMKLPVEQKGKAIPSSRNTRYELDKERGRMEIQPLTDIASRAADKSLSRSIVDYVKGTDFEDLLDPTTKKISRKGLQKITNENLSDTIQHQLGILHNYINSYTDPIYQTMGIDPSQLAMWQRYGMLGAGAVGGAGALMGNPYMMGAGALGLGAGLYPHFGGMANPWLHQNTGYHLPGTNTWKPIVNASPWAGQSGTTPPPPPPSTR